MSHTGVLKFVNEGPRETPNRGIRTFPHHTYGVSRESPDHFQQRHTIVNPHGYQYRHEKAPEFEYPSQQSSGILEEGLPDASLSIPVQGTHGNPYRFHLKKGRMGEFLDKNGWMNTVYLMNGHERSKLSRQHNNFDRTQKIQALKKTVEYHSQVLYQPKTNPNFHKTLEDIMSQKVRIRGRRNIQADKFAPSTQRALSERQRSQVDQESVQSKMAKTTKDFYKTLKGDRIQRGMSMRQGPISKLDFPEASGGDLQEWQRKTCRAKWCFKRQPQNQEEGQ